jgi:nucleoside 2-deoxyribosyltransferase
MKTVYLAGPISGLSFDGCTDWRNYAITKLALSKIKGVDPMRQKDYLKDEKNISDAYENHVMSCSRGIYTRDRYDCFTCDVLLVNLLGAKKVSIGTVMEIAWADSRQVPIIAVVEKEGNIHDHAMIREAIGFRVETLDEAIVVAQKILV